MTLISVKNAKLHRGGRDLVAVDRLDLHTGAFTAILGPNGAGKTSLIRLLSGEMRPDEGAVLFDGKDMAHWSAGDLARRRAVMVQDQRLDFPLRVSEVAGLGALPRQQKSSTRHRERRLVAQALEQVEAFHLADRWYPSLSGGEQQRVQLARALVQVAEAKGPDGPNVLMLDEPTASLDIAHQIDALEIAARFAQAGGLSLAILHDPLLARAHADRLVFLKEGGLVGDIPASSRDFDALCAQTYGARFNEEQRAWVRL